MKRIALTLASIVMATLLVSRIDTEAVALQVPSELVSVPQDEPQMLVPLTPAGEVCVDGSCSPVALSSDGSLLPVAAVASCDDCGPVRRVVSRVRERQPVRTVLRRVFRR